MVLYDIVTDVHPNIRRRKAGATINAGEAVYISGDETVTKTTNVTCAGNAFAGIAMDSVATNGYLGIATAPTEVYANATGSIAAGQYITPGADGYVANQTGTQTNQLLIGYAVKAAANNVVLMKLIDAPNIST